MSERTTGGGVDDAADDQYLGALAPMAATIRDEAVWIDPPSGLLDLIVAATGGPLPASDVVPITRARRRSWRWPAAAAAAAVVVFGTGFALGIAGDDDEPAADDGPPVAQLALVGTDLAPEAKAAVNVFDRGAGYALLLDTSGLEPAPEGTYYQGWLQAESGEQVSVGTFHMRNGDDTVVLWSGVAIEQYPTLVVTRQAEDGDGVGAGDLVMTGSLLVET